MSRPKRTDKGLPAYVRIRHGSYHYRNEKLCRVEEGEARMYELLAKLKAGLDLTMVPAAVAAFSLEHLATLSPSARKEHRRLLNIFAEEFSEFRVDQVRAHDVKRSVKNLFVGKPSAARHYKARISTFFRWCISDAGLVQQNPCTEVWIEKPRAKKSRWTDALFWAVRARLSPMHQCYHDLSFLLYQRTTDVRLLTRAQDRGTVLHFEPSKTLKSSGKAVDIPVTAEIREVLERAAELSRKWRVLDIERNGIDAQSAARWRHCPYVIHTRQGTPFTRSGIHSAYRRADEALHGGPGKAIGLSPKSLLPYAVTSAIKQGATIAQLQVGRAHASITTTEGYVQHHDVPVSEVRVRLPGKA